MGAFADHGQEFLDHGIAVIPTGGVDGKRPQVKNWSRIGVSASRNLLDSGRFDDANLAFTAGARSKLTVLDVDEPSEKALNVALMRFGESPVIIRTGSGKFQAWFKHNGERRMIRPIKGVELDILGAGIVIAPPSTRPDKAGAAYEFIAGDLDDIDSLPVLENLPVLDSLKSTGAGIVEVGRRNSELFRAALRALHSGVTSDNLGAHLIGLNETLLSEPLGAQEVARIASNAINIHERGENWVGEEARATITATELEALGGNADAALLLMKLRAAHGWRQSEPFALAKSYAETLGWTLPRFKSARSFLAEKKMIRCCHQGGRGPNDPPIFTLQ